MIGSLFRLRKEKFPESKNKFPLDEEIYMVAKNYTLLMAELSEEWPDTVWKEILEVSRTVIVIGAIDPDSLDWNEA